MRQKSTPNIPYGFCHCGCGQRTNISTMTNNRLGRKPGDPYKYISGHYSRTQTKVFLDTPESCYDVDPDTGCYNWKGTRFTAGYGSVSHEGKQQYAHVLMWIKTNGPVPELHEIHHTCENKQCVNPDHLVALTRREHMRLHPRKRNDRFRPHYARPLNWSYARLPGIPARRSLPSQSSSPGSRSSAVRIRYLRTTRTSRWIAVAAMMTYR